MKQRKEKLMSHKCILMMLLSLLWVSVAFGTESTGVPKIDQFFNELEEANRQIIQIEEKLSKIQFRILDLAGDPKGYVTRYIMQEFSDVNAGMLAGQQELITAMGNVRENAMDSAADARSIMENPEKSINALLEKLPFEKIRNPDGSLSIIVIAQNLHSLHNISKEIPALVQELIATQDSLMASLNQTKDAVMNLKGTSKDALNVAEGLSLNKLIKPISDDIIGLENDVKALMLTVKYLVNTSKELPQAVASMNKLKAPAVLKKIKQKAPLLESLVSNSQRLATSITQSFELLQAIATNKTGEFKLNLATAPVDNAEESDPARVEPRLAKAKEPAKDSLKRKINAEPYVVWSLFLGWTYLVLHAMQRSR